MNNATGGFLGAIVNGNASVSKAMGQNANVGKSTFLECLAAANMIVGTEGSFLGGASDAVRPLELQLGPYC